MKKFDDDLLINIKKDTNRIESNFVEKRKKRQQKKEREQTGRGVAPILFILTFLISLIVWLLNK